MRILLVGQAAFAEQVLQGLEAAGHEVAGVVCPPDRGDKLDPVKSAAIGRGIPTHQFPSLKTDQAREAFARADADLAILAYVTQIVPEPLLQLPRRTAICFHPSLLPRYRGGSAIPWQLIRGETRSGVTVFWPDAGIDTGPILLQREAPAGPDDTAGTLYFKTLFPLGVQTVLDSVQLIAEGRAPREPQDERLATYDPLLGDASRDDRLVAAAGGGPQPDSRLRSAAGRAHHVAWRAAAALRAAPRGRGRGSSGNGGGGGGAGPGRGDGERRGALRARPRRRREGRRRGGCRRARHRAR